MMFVSLMIACMKVVSMIFVSFLLKHVFYLRALFLQEGMIGQWILGQTVGKIYYITDSL